MTINLIDQHKNNSGILVGPGRDFGEGVIEAGNALTPGMGLGKGTAAGEVIPAVDALTCLGVVLENMKEGAATPRTAFVAGDRVRYLREPGQRFMGLVASGQTLVKGDYLELAAGKWVVATVATACARCIQEGGTGGALGADGYFLCKWGVDA